MAANLNTTPIPANPMVWIAATELRLTPPAISQQLKAIEDALGVALFERRGRTVRLTAAGATYLRDVQQLLSEAATATRRVRGGRASLIWTRKHASRSGSRLSARGRKSNTCRACRSTARP